MTTPLEFETQQQQAFRRAKTSALTTLGLPAASACTCAELETLANEAATRGDSVLALFLDQYRAGPEWKLGCARLRQVGH